MAGVVINTCSKIGEHCIINTSSVVEHDAVIADYVHISPGVTISGTVSIGECSWIGTGTSVINNIKICDNVMVGVGSVIIRDIKSAGTYFGTVSNK